MARRVLLLRALSAAIASLAAGAMLAAPASAADGRDRVSALSPVGNDISYPQCTSSGWADGTYTGTGSTTIPMGARFGIVGVNGGTAAIANPCLPAQLRWADSLPGLDGQPPLQLYVNTANPGAVLEQYEVTTWPLLTDPANPYNEDDGVAQACTEDGVGVNDLACSWQYGWNRAEWTAGLYDEAADVAGVSVDLADTVVWLDVETGNTWQTGTEGLERNAAALEGMAAFYVVRGAEVGLYSTAYQWNLIVGANGLTGTLAGLDSWLAGATNLRTAGAFCDTRPALTGGDVTLTQWVQRGFDNDLSCTDLP